MNPGIPNATSPTHLRPAAELGASRAAGPVAQAPTAARSSTSQASGTGASETAELATPKPMRFPWLSRLSKQLESVANQKPAFPSAPVLGDNVDRSA